MAENPGNLSARWFLNIVAMTLGDYPQNLPPDAVIPPRTFASSHDPGHGNHWVKLRLQGTRANRPGIGARLTLKVRGPSGERTLHRTVSTGGSFGSNPLRQEIGLGDARTILSLRVEWPGSGTVQNFSDLEPDRLYLVRETNPAPEKNPLRTFTLPLPPASTHRSDP